MYECMYLFIVYMRMYASMYRCLYEVFYVI